MTQDPFNSALQQQVGRQSSRGIEWSGAWRLGYGFSIEANAALLCARFDDFNETENGVVVSRNGNTPTNIPEQTANFWLTYAPTHDVSVGARLRYVGRRYPDNVNTVPIPFYTVFDASAQWQATRNVNSVLYLRNLANRAYAVTSETPAEWLLGPARSAEAVATVKF